MDLLVNFLHIIQCQISQLLISKEKFNHLPIINVFNCNKKKHRSMILSVCVCVCVFLSHPCAHNEDISGVQVSVLTSALDGGACEINFMPWSHYARKQPHKPSKPWTQYKCLDIRKISCPSHESLIHNSSVFQPIG